MATYTPNPADLRAWNTFDKRSQQVLLSGGQVRGGDGRTFTLIDGHATVVGSASYKQGMALRNPSAAPVPQRVPTVPAAGPATTPPGSPAPDKGGWMSPSTGAGVVQVPAQAPIDPAKLDAQRDALALIQQTLADYGLPASLADWAWQEIVAGKGEAQVLLDLRQRPEFKTRFPGIDLRQKAGLAPISPAEYVAYEQAARQTMRAAGLPPGMFDSQDDFTKWIAGDVSIKELADRVNQYEQIAYHAPAEDKATFLRYYGGMGDLTALLMDPNVAEPLIKQKWAAAQIGGAAQRTGVGADQVLAERLALQGVTPEQAQQGFSQIGALGQEITRNLPGEGSQIGNISLNDEANAVFAGDVAQRKRISDRQRERTAVFEGGGGFAQTRGGTGIGSAQAA